MSPHAGEEAYALDPRVVARGFGSASRSYDAAAGMQAAVRAELLSRVGLLRTTPTAVLDLGCGTGAGAAELKRRFRRAQVVAADIAPGMIAAARRRSRLWRRFDCALADAHALPFEDRRFDLVFSNLMLQWADPLDAALGEIRRVLRPGGLLLASSFGPETLQELRAAWAEADDHVHVNRFIDVHDFGAAMQRAGFAEPVLDVDRHRAWHPDVPSLMRELKRIGAHNVNAGRSRGLTGRTRLARMVAAYERRRESRGLPATWQVVYAVGWAPLVAERLDAPVGAETRISLASLKAGLVRR